MISFSVMTEGKKKNIKVNTNTIVKGLLILLCFLPLISDFVRGREYYEYREASMIDARLGQVAGVSYSLQAGDEFRQTFSCTYDRLKWIALAIPTGENEDSGSAGVRLLDKNTGHVLGEWEIAGYMADENGWIYLNIDPAEGSDIKGMECELVVSVSSDSQDDPCAIWSAGNDYYDKGSLIFNGVKQDDDLFMIIRGYSGRSYFKWVRTWLCIYMALLVYVIWILAGRRKVAKA